MKPFIIAEIGVNHDGRVDKAVTLIDIAVAAGADAVKFQSFAAERLASLSTPKVAYQLQRDTNRSHFDMLKSLELSFSDQEYLYNYCNRVNIEFMSTPYSLIDASFLNDLGVQKFKVASADIVDIPLHELISGFGKMTLVSTGMATPGEIDDVAKIYRAKGTSLILLHTTSEYPASYLNANLEKLRYLKSKHPEGIGYSDHTPDSICSIMAISYGCTYFEKHLTINKSDPGPDHSASLDEAEFARYVSEIQKASMALGEIGATRSEKEDDMARTSRKSLHFGTNLKAGAILQLNDLILLRPGYGMPWSKHSDIVGRILLRDVEKFELISSNDFL